MTLEESLRGLREWKLCRKLYATAALKDALLCDAIDESSEMQLKWKWKWNYRHAFNWATYHQSHCVEASFSFNICTLDALRLLIATKCGNWRTHVRRTPIWTRHNKNYKLCDGYQMRLSLGNQSIRQISLPPAKTPSSTPAAATPLCFSPSPGESATSKWNQS